MFVEAASKGGTQKGKLEIRRKASASIARKRTQVNGKAVTGTWLTRWAKIYWLAAVSQLLPKVLGIQGLEKQMRSLSRGMYSEKRH